MPPPTSSPLPPPPACLSFRNRIIPSLHAIILRYTTTTTPMSSEPCVASSLLPPASATPHPCASFACSFPYVLSTFFHVAGVYLFTCTSPRIRPHVRKALPAMPRWVVRLFVRSSQFIRRPSRSHRRSQETLVPALRSPHAHSTGFRVRIGSASANVCWGLGR